VKIVRRCVWLSAPLVLAATLLGAARAPGPVSSGAPPPEQPIPSVPIIRIVGAAKPKIPIALPAFTAPADTKVQEFARTIHDVINDDLDFSGYFSLVPEEYHKLVHGDPGGKINYKEWIGVGADALVFGQVTFAQPNIVFEGKLFDTADEKILLGKLYRGEPDLARVMAHKLSNEIAQQFTDQAGIFLSKIAFVSQVGKAKEIYVMDYDGARAKRITANNTINLSPAWSPDGKQIAFVSYRSGSPVLMIVNSDGVLRQSFPQQGELNSAPAWSPDGNLIAFTSTRDGNAEIYVQRLSETTPRRLTTSDAIDTSPAWSPDGRQIAFTSDRAGSPQIYTMNADGSNLRRLTSNVSYCDAASWSLDGKKIAFTARVAGGFDIFLLDIDSQQVARLTENSNINEWPRFSPDGKHLAFASNRTGNFDVYTMDIDGSHVRRLTHGGNSYSPSWSR
jgi:TolB protein